MEICPATEADWPQIYDFFQQIVGDGRTYAYPENLTSDAARTLWFAAEPGHTAVAVKAGRVLGSASMEPNRPGRGNHVATASFMVADSARGQGVGRALGVYVIDWATAHNYRGIQFNAVVEVNEPAVKLWRSLGFEVIGTVPGAFCHRELGYVGLHVMYRPITENNG